MQLGPAASCRCCPGRNGSPCGASSSSTRFRRCSRPRRCSRSGCVRIAPRFGPLLPVRPRRGAACSITCAPPAAIAGATGCARSWPQRRATRRCGAWRAPNRISPSHRHRAGGAHRRAGRHPARRRAAISGRAGALRGAEFIHPLNWRSACTRRSRREIDEQSSQAPAEQFEQAAGSPARCAPRSPRSWSGRSRSSTTCCARCSPAGTCWSRACPASARRCWCAPSRAPFPASSAASSSRRT